MTAKLIKKLNEHLKCLLKYPEESWNDSDLIEEVILALKDQQYQIDDLQKQIFDLKNLENKL